jgi:hypothetical protein
LKGELISKATRNEFREVFVGFVLREIDMIFEAAGIEARTDFQPLVSGQRRGLVEQYYASLDFSSPADARKLVVAFEELIEQLHQVQGRVTNPEVTQRTIDTLLRRMARDGFRYENGRFVSHVFQLHAVEAPSLIGLTEASITEQIEKARAKIELGDYPGAIAVLIPWSKGF